MNYDGFHEDFEDEGLEDSEFDPVELEAINRQLDALEQKC